MTNEQAATDVVVRDGSTVCLRRADERDVAALLAFLSSLSVESLYYRFMGLPALDESRVRRLICGSTIAATSVIAEAGGRIVAFAGFHPDPAAPGRAEVAFAVSDAMQGHGIGTRLLEHLASLARESGIQTFDAYVLGANRRMLDLFRDSGFAEKTAIESGVCHVTLTLAVTERFAEQAAARSRTAATASMKAFFEPRVVAVVGANRERGKIGAEILHNLVDAGFRGSIVPVHPTAQEVGGLPAYPRVSAIPGPIDLAVIVVPAAEVLSVVDECISKNVRAICVISAGFSECDAEGRARETMLLERVRQAGCRLIGPNCMGLLNTDPVTRLNATFSPVYPPAGTVAMSTQSGALGLAILDYAKRLNIGISSFVSVGNKADVSGNDLIQVLGRGSANVGHPALSRELRQSKEVQRHRSSRRTIEADCRGQGRPLVGRLAGRRLAHRGAGVERCGRRRAVPAGRCDSDRSPRRAVRRRRAARASAGAAGRTGCYPHQCRWSRHPRRRRLRGARARAAFTERHDARGAALVPAGGGQRRKPRRYARVGARRSLPQGVDRHPAGRAHRQRHRDFHSTARHRAGRRRCRVDRSDTRHGDRQAGTGRVHARRGRSLVVVSDSLIRVSRVGRPGAGARDRVRPLAGKARGTARCLGRVRPPGYPSDSRSFARPWWRMDGTG